MIGRLGEGFVCVHSFAATGSYVLLICFVKTMGLVHVESLCGERCRALFCLTGGCRDKGIVLSSWGYT